MKLKLTSHEKTILELISKHPDIVDSPSARKLIAKQYGFTEKTLRNRIGDLKKYGIIKSSDHSSKGVQKIHANETNLMDIIPLLWSMRKSIINNQLIIIVITMIGLNYISKPILFY